MSGGVRAPPMRVGLLPATSRNSSRVNDQVAVAGVAFGEPDFVAPVYYRTMISRSVELETAGDAALRHGRPGALVAGHMHFPLGEPALSCGSVHVSAGRPARRRGAQEPLAPGLPSSLVAGLDQR